MVTLLDGPLGTELLARGVETPEPAWSAAALTTAPDVVSSIHAAYARAGAQVHTANTFRTRPEAVGRAWPALARRAVSLCRAAVGGGQVAGSLAPLADCYRPDLSPPDPEPRHAALAGVLADAGCDLLLVETFPHVGEAVAATRAAVGTGLPVWTSLTAGPQADLLTPLQVARGAEQLAEAGAEAILINCTPARVTHLYVAALVDALAGSSVAVGAYANAGHPSEGLGWSPGAAAAGARRYAAFAARWVDQGATLVGACCGTGPQTIAALRSRWPAPLAPAVE